MQIKQFEDKHLSHYSYALLSDNEKKMALIDPARNPQPYIDYAKNNDAEIIGIVETHTHADFVSGHLELHHLTGATIYISELAKVSYPHVSFDVGQIITFGEVKLFALNTPGHSDDSISVLSEEDSRQIALFTGDTLFIGDCGRPDLREDEADASSKRESLAKQMYHSLRFKLAKLPQSITIYPAHGAGSLCGKSLSDEKSSTIAREMLTNWSLQEMSEKEFVKRLLEDQPFIPRYFSFDIKVNSKGAASLKENIGKIKVRDKRNGNGLVAANDDAWMIDTRNEKEYKKGHYPRSINLMENGSFETWLGVIIEPGENFYIASKDEEQLERMLRRTGSIGYETAVKEAIITDGGNSGEEILDTNYFKDHTNDYTIIDVRNESEAKDHKLFNNSISIPLPELREHLYEIPTSKPIVVHCSSGYRSAAASSLMKASLDASAQIFDLGESVNLFQT